jgi:hypothetical protein
MNNFESFSYICVYRLIELFYENGDFEYSYWIMGKSSPEKDSMLYINPQSAIISAQN